MTVGDSLARSCVRVRTPHGAFTVLADRGGQDPGGKMFLFVQIPPSGRHAVGRYVICPTQDVFPTDLLERIPMSCARRPMHVSVAWFLAAIVACRLTTGVVVLAQTAANQIPAAQREALRTLIEAGGILIQADDRQPDYPVLTVDFNGQPELDGACLQALAAFPKLAALSLRGTPVADQDLQTVGKLVSLATLDLSDTDITDEGAEQLQGLKKLASLNLKGTHVTAEAVAELQKALPRCEISWEPLAEKFSAAKLETLRKKCRKVSQVLDITGIPMGWSKSTLDPNKLLSLFNSLKLRKGYTLRAYQLNVEWLAQAVVWAMPNDAEFPEPEDCPRLDNTPDKTPKPYDALDDVLEAVEGDDSPSSYLAASIFRREALAFGILSAGTTWHAHVVLDKEPAMGEFAPEPEVDSPFPTQPMGDPEEWKWNEDRPRDWRPQVKMEKDKVVVTFYTYCGLHPEGYHRHTDTYRRGKYRARTEDKQVAEGTQGVAF